MMKYGMIIEKGTHEEFLSDDTFYADSYNILFANFSERLS
ncbi:hypothetical protein J22TS3_11010 [Paenibacillus sp. J22TS3]|nr:hypothetical protein J22TS3_11010 [Paenibacillus sp. J22TS3]